MNQEMQNLRDALVEHLHELADEQDQHARSAIQESDLQRETAHRGAAIGLRMAAAAVSANLGPDPVRRSPGSLRGEPDSLIGAGFVPRQLVTA